VEHAETLPAWIKEAYSQALLRSAAKQKKADAYQLYPYTRLLDKAGVEALLKAVKKHPEVFRLVSAQIAMQEQSHGADALAALLDEPERGHDAALALGSMGKEGVRAAEEFLKAQSIKETPGTALAKLIRSLPPPPNSIWAGEQLTLPRF